MLSRISKNLLHLKALQIWSWKCHISVRIGIHDTYGKWSRADSVLVIALCIRYLRLVSSMKYGPEWQKSQGYVMQGMECRCCWHCQLDRVSFARRAAPFRDAANPLSPCKWAHLTIPLNRDVIACCIYSVQFNLKGRKSYLKVFHPGSTYRSVIRIKDKAARISLSLDYSYLHLRFCCLWGNRFELGVVFLLLLLLIFVVISGGVCDRLMTVLMKEMLLESWERCWMRRAGFFFCHLRVP